jgi:hypothetical protein
MAPAPKSGGVAPSTSRATQLRHGQVTPEPTPPPDLHKNKSSNGGGAISDPNKDTSNENNSATVPGSAEDMQDKQRKTVERIFQHKDKLSVILDVEENASLEEKRDKFMKVALMVHPNVIEGDKEKEAFGGKLRAFS